MRQRSSPSWAVLAASLVASACGGGSPTGPTPPTPGPFASHTSAQFVFRYTPLDAATIADTAAAVEAQHTRILADLEVGQVSVVTVTLYPDRDSFRAAVVPLVGNVPSFASGLVTGPSQIHILSPNLASQWSYPDGVQSIVHEFAHCVSMHANPSIPNNPRWLWETVALYEAGQVADPHTLAYMRSHQPPGLAQLNQLDDTTIYDVGGLIGDAVVETWGRGALRGLVDANGDLQAALGVDESRFTSLWFESVSRRYGL